MSEFLIEQRDSADYYDSVYDKNLRDNATVISVLNKKTMVEDLYIIEYTSLCENYANLVAYRFDSIDGNCLEYVEKSFDIYIKSGACCHLSLPNYSSHHICGEDDFNSYIELLKLSYHYTNKIFITEFGRGISCNELDLFNEDEYLISQVILPNHSGLVFDKDKNKPTIKINLDLIKEK